MGHIIETSILKLVWNIFIKGPLIVIDGFNQVMQYLSGGVIYSLLFGTAKNGQGQDIFAFNSIPVQFWYFAVFGLFVLLLVIIVQYIVIMHSSEGNPKEKIYQVLKSSGKALLFVLIIPLGFFFVNELVMFGTSYLNMIFGSNKGSMAENLYYVGNPDWDGGISNVPSNFAPPGNITDYNIIVEVFAVWFFVFATFMLGLQLAQKVIELMFLFFVSPIVFAKMPSDNGKGALIWKDLCLGKMFATLGVIVSYNVFMLSMSLFLKNGATSFGSTARMVLTVLFICGGALATLGMSSTIASFLGESVGAMEGLSSMRSTVQGGLFAAGAAKMVGRALGMAKNKKLAKSGLGSMNPFSGGSQNSETMGNNDIPSRGIKPGKWQNRSGAIGMLGKGITAAGIAYSALRTVASPFAFGKQRAQNLGGLSAKELKTKFKAGEISKTQFKIYRSKQRKAYAKGVFIDPFKSAGKRLKATGSTFGKSVAMSFQGNKESVKNKASKKNTLKPVETVKSNKTNINPEIKQKSNDRKRKDD